MSVTSMHQKLTHRRLVEFDIGNRVQVRQELRGSCKGLTTSTQEQIIIKFLGRLIPMPTSQRSTRSEDQSRFHEIDLETYYKPSSHPITTRGPSFFNFFREHLLLPRNSNTNPSIITIMETTRPEIQDILDYKIYIGEDLHSYLVRQWEHPDTYCLWLRTKYLAT